MISSKINDTDADTDIKKIVIADTDADTDTGFFLTADTDVDTDMNFLKPRTRTRTRLFTIQIVLFYRS